MYINYYTWRRRQDSFMAAVRRTIDHGTPLQCRDGARRVSGPYHVGTDHVAVFTDQGGDSLTMHACGRSLSGRRPAHLYNAGMEHPPGFHGLGRHGVHQATSVVICSASRMTRGGGGKVFSLSITHGWS